MQFYFAPMEGITGYVFRNAYDECFHNIDKYFSPFIVPHRNRGFKTRELRDIFPENNKNIYLVPQILTNDAGDFLRTAEEFQEMGYEEVNLNLGCPSGTVTAKGKGAGFLAEPEKLDEFLDRIFSESRVKISIKTRIGVEERGEFYRLLDIYRKYPVHELIIHPRLLKDYYKNTPDREMFAWAVKEYPGRMIYNGDIFTKEHYKIQHEQTPDVQGVMLGRGILMNAGLVGEINGEPRVNSAQLKEFHDKILVGYETMLSGDKNILFRMKELWFYMIYMFHNHEKYAKKLKKVQTVEEYRRITSGVFRELSMLETDEEPAFIGNQ